MDIQPRLNAPLTTERAERIFIGAELVANGMRNRGYCTIRKDDEIENTANLIKEAIRMKCEVDAQAAKQGGREDMVRREYAARQRTMLDNIEEIHRSFKPRVPIREKLSNWLGALANK
ncbi:hypothetical protein JKY72_05600 [Candidatus Gracilibacteria bacterium]|nr:hypothetical protein [Candidatus Gracilibacteria bacterium]